MMHKKEFIEQIKSCKKLFGYVKITLDDGVYLRLNKEEVIQGLRYYNDNDNINAELRNNNLYIN